MHSKLDEEKSVPLLYVLASMHFIEQYTWSTQVLEKTHKRYVSSRILGAFKGKKKVVREMCIVMRGWWDHKLVGP